MCCTTRSDISQLQERFDERDRACERLSAANDARSSDLNILRVQLEENLREKGRVEKELSMERTETQRTKQEMAAVNAEIERLKQWHVWLKQAEGERLREEKDKFENQLKGVVQEVNEWKIEAEKFKSKAENEKNAKEVLELELKVKDCSTRLHVTKHTHAHANTLTSRLHSISIRPSDFAEASAGRLGPRCGDASAPFRVHLPGEPQLCAEPRRGPAPGPAGRAHQGAVGAHAPAVKDGV